MSDLEIVPEILEEAKSRMKWITHKGKEILIDDYRNLQGDVFPSMINAIVSLTLKTGKKDLLVIVDVRDSFANKETVNAFNNAGKASKEILRKTAVLGITGVKKILLNVVNKFSKVGAKPFDTMEEAKEWLVQ
ncbi:MAG: hypothetical protein JW891_05200 [Candidatus Lokiarchaeota archaeon]|nr:hypothetical protein [Candidatus Lokiarchaeota archaeon]